MREKVKWNVGMVLRRVERWRDRSVRGGVIMKEWRQGYMEVEEGGGGVGWGVYVCVKTILIWRCGDWTGG